MAPLNPNNTERYKVFYTAAGVAHNQEIRTDGVSPSALGAKLDEYYTELGDAIYETTIDDVQFAAQGSDIFNSVNAGVAGNTYGSGDPAVVGEVPYFYSFIGRSTGGRRVRFFQFGAKGLGGDYRFPAGENALLDAARGVIDGATNIWLAIDGITPVWKSYINAGVNAYWQRNVRP